MGDQEHPFGHLFMYMHCLYIHTCTHTPSASTRMIHAHIVRTHSMHIQVIHSHTYSMYTQYAHTGLQPVRTLTYTPTNPEETGWNPAASLAPLTCTSTRKPHRRKASDAMWPALSLCTLGKWSPQQGEPFLLPQPVPCRCFLPQWQMAWACPWTLTTPRYSQLTLFQGHPPLLPLILHKFLHYPHGPL